jgi:hypothetical protein
MELCGASGRKPPRQCARFTRAAYGRAFTAQLGNITISTRLQSVQARRLRHFGMAESRGARSGLATVVGYVLVAIIAYFVLRLVLGTIFWLIRTIVIIVVIGGLLLLYLNLKAPKE